MHGELCIYLDKQKVDGAVSTLPTDGGDLAPLAKEEFDIPWSLSGYANNRIENGSLEIRATVDGQPAVEAGGVRCIPSTCIGRTLPSVVDGYKFRKRKV